MIIRDWRLCGLSRRGTRNEQQRQNRAAGRNRIYAAMRWKAENLAASSAAGGSETAAGQR